MSPAICFNLDQSNILSSGNGLTLNVHLYHIAHREQILAVVKRKTKAPHGGASAQLLSA